MLTNPHKSRYPYPLNPRLYIYAQRKAVDSTGKSMVVVSRALDESNYPDGSDKARNASVRVTDYSSRLLVRAHSDMNKVDKGGWGGRVKQ
jgi:hypothetical protein